MSQSFFLRSVNSDLSVGGALFNRQLLEDTATAASQVVSLAANETLDAYAFTEPGIPGADGGMGDYTVSIHITSGATQINVSSRLARVNSSGTVQAEGGFSAPDPGNAGVKVHEFESFSLGTWEAGDRLRVQYRFVNTDTMMARSLTIEKNTVETELITPWGVGEPETLEFAGALPGLEGSFSFDASSEAALAGVLPGLEGSFSFDAAAFDPPDADVTINGTTAELTWSVSPTPGVVDYQVFRRTPQTGAPFDPETDTPVATEITDLFYDDEGLAPGDYDWQIFGAQVQFAQPDSTVAHGGWDDVGGVVSQSELHTLLDEGVATADDDATRARSPNGPSNATLEVGLSNVDDPSSLVDHVLRARFRLAINDATIDATAALVQGTTVIASVTRQFVGAVDDVNWITVTHTLTEAEADEITDYTDLRIRLAANQVAGTSRRLQVTAAELEVPALVDQLTSGSQVVQAAVGAVAEVAFAGVLPGLTGSFELAASAQVSVDGNLPGLEGSFGLVNVNTLALTGTLPGLEASLDLEASSDIAVAGILPALEGSFTTAAATDVALAGLLPALEGSFAFVEITDTITVALAGTLPGLEATFATSAGSTVALAGGLPGLEGSFQTAAQTDLVVAGLLPGLDGSFAAVMGNPTVILAGQLPGLNGSFAVAASTDVVLVGTLPGLDGSLVLAVEIITVTVDGMLPGLEGSFVADATAPSVVFAGTLPGPTMTMTFASGADLILTGNLPGLEGSFRLAIGELVDLVIDIGPPSRGWSTGGLSRGWQSGKLVKT